jgi:nitrite reductase/ring-hydroxylating ferredoxin subunit
MGGEAKLTGPDLVEGVPLADLPEGKPFAAHAHGEAIVVVKRGASLRMIGGTCTHYGAPLADGLVVGDTIRCPWHHACFDLETGEARGAPALSAIACHDVVVRDGRAFIGPKKELPRASKHASAPDSIVVLGAGAAGAAAVEQLRTRGYSGSITMVGDELPGPVDRPNLSKDYLAGNAPEEWVTLRGADFYAGIDVTLIVGDAAVAIDKAASTVTLASGKVLHYGALLLATGAEPIRLPIPGAELPHVFTLRSLADSRAIIERASGAKRAVVIGSSFIGLEAAASLRARGLEVDVVGRDALPLENVLGAELGAFVQ